MVSLLCGEHHKRATSKFILMRWYYEKRWFLGVNCLGAEVNNIGLLFIG